MSRIATIPLAIDIDYRVLAEHICDVLEERNLSVTGRPPNTVIDAYQARILLGRAPGRPLSYPSLRKLIQQGHLTTVPGEDRRMMYFMRADVERLMVKK